MTLAALALSALVVAASLALYLSVTGKSLPLLRTLARQAGMLVTAQHTDHLALDLLLSPADGRLAGTATLSVRSLDAGRQRFYFLLNNALHLRSVTATTADTPSRSVAAYQLWLLTVVDLDAPIAKDATVELAFDYDGMPATGLFSLGSNRLDLKEVLLNVDSFWFPNDAHSFFTADVTVTLPTDLTIVQNGTPATRIQRGDIQVVHWLSERPIAGLALVAGAYTASQLESGEVTYRVYLPPSVQLDADRVLKMMRDTTETLTDHYGSAGYRTVTLFVSRALRRGFNDGSGLMGLSLRYFRAGDYGFALVAHEIAHNWWGSTVAAKWLSPGSGGEWLVEGFAEFSSLVATEAAYGTEALTRRLATEFFDPARQVAIADMSVIDNALAEATARDTIYRKGAYVAMMLRRTLGDDTYFTGLRQFLERFRYQQATDRDLQETLEGACGQKLDAFFTDWVRSDHLADLALDAGTQNELSVANLGNAAVPGGIELWTYQKGGGDPTRTTVHVGDKIALRADTDFLVLDPLLAWADVQRQNNRYPRRNDPVYVSASSKGDLAVTRGDAFPWVRAAVSSADTTGGTRHSWDLNRGVAAPPAWSTDGTRIVVSYADVDELLPAIVTLATDGPQRTVGRGTAPAASDGTIFAAQHDRIVRISATATGDSRETVIVQRRGETLDLPLPSPDGSHLVYSAARGNHLALRIVDRSGADDRLLSAWDRDRTLYRWSADGTRLYAVVGGNWDWQIWEIPLDREPVRVLAHDAAAIGDLALSPDGTQLAFTAAPALDYPTNRRQLYVLTLANRSVRSIDVPDADLGGFAWTDAGTIIAVAADTERTWTLPLSRRLKRINVVDGSAEDLP